MGLARKDLLGLEDLTQEDIELILDNAKSMKEVLGRSIKKVPTLRGKLVVNLFYEPSTRTKSSFSLAAKRLSADGMSISAKGSSVVKGESLVDTARTLRSLGADAVVIRHGVPGAALARVRDRHGRDGHGRGSPAPLPGPDAVLPARLRVRPCPLVTGVHGRLRHPGTVLQ